MAADKDVKQLNKLLIDHVQKHEHAKVVETTKLLQGQGEDSEELLKTIVTAFLFLERFDEVLEMLNGRDSLPFEHAYAFYRNRDHQRAYALLQQMDEPRQKQLKAQLAIRLENFETSAMLYEDLLEDDQLSKQEREGLLTNLSSVYVSAERFDDAIRLLKDVSPDDETVHILLNRSSAFIGLKEFDVAEESLRRAIELCGSLDLAASEIKEELAPLQVQLGYVRQQLNDPAEAHSLYLQALHAFDSDRSDAVVAVACTNLISLRKGDERIFDSEKKSKLALRVPHEKLTKQQRIAIKRNHALLLMYEKLRADCKAAVKELERLDSSDEFPQLVLASLLFREKKFLKCEELLKGCMSTDAQLSLGHIYLVQGNVSGCISVLDSLPPSLRHRPAVVAISVALYVRLDAKGKAAKSLEQAVLYYQSGGGDADCKACLGTLLRASADFQQSQGLYTEARRTLQALLEHGLQDESDREFVLAKLALVSAFAGADDAATFVDALPGLHAISEQHLAALEDEIQQSASSYRRKPKPDAQQKKEEQQQKEQEVKVRKKKRKPRYPKDFNPKNPGPPPDPERWLPRYERSYYSKGRGRRAHDGITKGAQGMVANAAAAGRSGRAPREDKNRQHNLRQQAAAQGNAAAAQPQPQQKKKKKKKGGFEY